MRNANRANPSGIPLEVPAGTDGVIPAAAGPVEFEFWHSLRIPGLQIIHSNRHEHDYPAHLHDALEIIWIRSGSARLTCRDRTYEIVSGEAGIVPPNEIHSGGCSKPHLEYVAIHIPREILQQIFGSFQVLVDSSGNPVPFKLMSRDQATTLLPILVRAICADLPAEKLLYLLQPVLCPMLDAPSPQLEPVMGRASLHPAVCMAKSIIRDQCANRVDINELAERVDLDMRYLISLFKLATGMTPHQFQIAMRVDLARCLIQDKLPLCEVAARAGFSDQSHLNRHFKRQYGFTPGAFRESLTERQNLVLS